MTLTYLVLLVLISVAVASVATWLALSCKIHPVTQAVIIPGSQPTAKPEEEPKKLASDLNSRRKLLRTIAIALGLVLFMSVNLWLMTHTESLVFLEPLARWMERHLNPNVIVVILVVLMALIQIPGIARVIIWMTPRRAVAMVSVYLLMLLAWVGFDSWLTINLIAALVVINSAVVLQLGMSYLRLSMIMMIAAVLYDAWQVYGTHNMMEVAENAVPVVGEVEREYKLPMLFMIPAKFALTPEAYGFLGSGDVLVLSLMAISAARLGKKVGSRVPLVATFVGFAAAMLACGWVVWHFNFGQPATIFIVPLCALPIIIHAKWRGYFDQLTVPFYVTPRTVAPVDSKQANATP